MVVGFAVAIPTTSHAVVMTVFGEFAPAIAVSHGGSDVVSVTVIIAVVLVMVIVIVVYGVIAVVVMMPRIVVCPVVIWVVPSPTIVEPIIIPIRGIIVGTIVMVWPPPVITHVNA